MTASPATVCTGTNISLSCTASNSPTNYRWYRCSSASIADSTAIGSGATASLSYSTTGLAAGSYYFGVIAENASGKDTAVTASAVTVKTSITPSLSYASVGGTSLAVGESSSGSPTVSGNTGSGTVTYSVSPSGYATVHSSTGVVTGDHVGSATVTASVAATASYCAGSATASFTITCAPITPTFSTDYSSTSLNVGANSSTPAIDKDGSSGAITWTSSDEDVATVNGSGVVTAKAVGTTSITATVAANVDYCSGSVSESFTVSCATPSISVSPASAAYCKNGAATALSFTGSGHNAQKWQYYDGDSWEDIDGATNATYTPSTSATGSTQYRVVTTCNNYASNTQTSSAATVTVKAPLSLSLSYTSTTLTEGDDSSSPTLTGNSGSGAVTYSVTAASPSGSATVDSGTGVVSAVKAGSATVTASVVATASYCAGSTTANFTINPSCDDSELSVSMD